MANVNFDVYYNTSDGSVTYKQGSTVVTGDVTLNYGDTDVITFTAKNNSGRWVFTGISFDPTAGAPTVDTNSADSIQVTQTDCNTSGQDESWEYTLAFRNLATGNTTYSDPAIVNRHKIQVP